MRGSYLLAPRIDPRFKLGTYGALLVTIMVLSLGPEALAILASLGIIALFLIRRPAPARTALHLSLAITGILLSAVPIFMGAIPLAHPELRYSSYRVLYLAAGYLIVAAISIRADFRLFLIGEVIALVSTFRTTGLAVALAYFLKLLQRGRPRTWGIKRILALSVALSVIAGVFLARYLATVNTYSRWELGFLETLLYRPGATYTVYERLFDLGMPWGKGWILLRTDPKMFVGALFGRDVGYTYTLFGQPVYDFGVVGLAEAVILGAALRDSMTMEEAKILSVVLLTLAIPIGLDAFFMSGIVYLALLSTWDKLSRETTATQKRPS
ncbi:oligosaccharide repeat unit polymerase family protein [Thermococcus sp. M36]|uniref:oligosaccharide repeat unit polymerase family protein n=1 Tax=Thermococcus sp. M36 TaxID=1638261 RepID=UPI001F0F129F|nr:oligosaccharide repeat unit polymerase family protein [Thermococcus sp. M36]